MSQATSDATTNSVRPVPLAEVGEPTHVTDVLVVGCGAAGAAAAWEARKAGAEVIVLERGSGPGGSSAQSGGELYLGGGTPIQQANGYTDSADSMFEYLRVALGPHADEAKLRVYCDGSVEHFEWFRTIGVEFEDGFFSTPSWMPPTTDGLMWLGENAHPYNEVTDAVPRGHRPNVPGEGGWKLMELLSAALDDVGAQIHPDTRARALIVDGNRVVGVVARSFGKPVSYVARRGVVLATGGFVDNEEMLLDNAPILSGHGKISDGYDDGLGIKMGQAVGAAVRRMGYTQVSIPFVPELACRGMMINGHGQRFINEDVYPGLVSQAAIREPAKCWVILDDEGHQAVTPGGWEVPPKFVAETPAELEEELGLPTGSLQATIAEYNANAEQAVDPVFHKDPKWLRPLGSPLAAFDPNLRGEGTGFSGFTLGGLHTTVDTEVLDLDGAVIPGLYAVGRCSSSIHGEGYISGTSLGDGTFFGRRAGRAAAAQG